MRIAYFCCHPDHLKLGALSVASARACMPGVEIVHLTDEVTGKLQGADTVMRFATEGNFWRRSWTAAAALDGDVLLLGTDTIFRRDVTGVFAQPFTIALPHIADKRWKWDAGTVFSRRPDFFMAMAGDPVSLLPHDSLDVDRYLTEYHRCVASLGAGVKALPGEIYGYVPKSATDPGISGAAIVHYRGPRKRWMLPEWDVETERCIAWATATN